MLRTFRVSTAAVAWAFLASAADTENSTICIDGVCPDAAEGQVLLQSRRGSAVKKIASEEYVSKADGLWEQFGGDKQRCSGTEFRVVKDQEACQLLAITRGHPFYSFFAFKKWCDTSDTCDSPRSMKSMWKVYSTDMWQPYGNPGTKCTNVKPLKAKTRLFCQHLATKLGKKFYAYDDTAQLCNVAGMCNGVEAAPEWQSYSADALPPTPAPTPWPADMQVDDYEIVGYGACKHKKYSFVNKALSVNRKLCAAQCTREPKCAYFSFAPGKDCARYVENSHSCFEESGRAIFETEYVTYRKPPPPTPASASGGSSGPGADWTEEEVLITMAKVYALVYNMNNLRVSWKDKFECYADHPDSRPDNVKYVPCSYWCLEPVNKKGCGRFGDTNYYNERGVEPQENMAMLVRFGFHQCLKNKDGSGGCNGCLNLENAFLRTGGLMNPPPPKRSRPMGHNGHNANLALTADQLEKIYTKADYPPWGPMLPQSLKASGKSRADLWALAATTAVFKGIHQATADCDNSYSRNIYASELMPSGFPCKITLQRPMAFYTGRSDCQDTPTLWKCEPSCKVGGLLKKCVSQREKCGGCLMCPRVETMDVITYRPRPYENTKAENHPFDWFNGSELSQFFKKDYNMNRRETVVIMGGHTLGVFHGEVSGGYRYIWTHKQQAEVTNIYYRIIAALPGKHYEAFEEAGVHMAHPVVVGGAQQKIVATGFTLWNGNTEEGGGPFQWFHQYCRCPTCYEGKNADRHHYLWVKKGVDYGPRCCELCAKATFMEGGKVRNLAWKRGEDKWNWRYTLEGLDDSEKAEFEQYGCLRNLSVHETLLTVDVALAWEIPHSAKGFPIVEGHTNTSATFRPWIKLKPNTLVDEDSGKTMSEIVLEYANDQDLWASDFVATWEKMLTNGVDPGALKKSFEFDNVVCSKGVSLQENKNYVNKAPHVNWKCEKVQ